MFMSGKKLFKACCRSGTNANPSLWVLYNIAPHHAKDIILDKYYATKTTCIILDKYYAKTTRIILDK